MRAAVEVALPLYAPHHAVEALAVFYPRADIETVLEEVARGIEIERDTAVGLVGRQGCRRGNDSRYVLHRERTGLFVLRGPYVVTFLRFYGLHQHVQAARLWPGGDPPTCLSSWLPALHRPEPVAYVPTLTPSVSTGAARAAGMTKAAIQALVVYAVTRGLEIPGEVKAGPVRLAVVRVDSGIRVVLSARSEAEIAERERRNGGIRQAAELLRKQGWTCTPPEAQGPQEGT